LAVPQIAPLGRAQLEQQSSLGTLPAGRTESAAVASLRSLMCGSLHGPGCSLSVTANVASDRLLCGRRGVGGVAHQPTNSSMRPPRCVSSRVPPSGGTSEGAARCRNSRGGQACSRSGWAAARVGRAAGDLGDRGAVVSVAAGEGGEVGWLPRLGAVRLLARAAGHGPGADHGVAGDSRPWRSAGGDAAREAASQERAAVVGLAGARRAGIAHPAAGRGGILVAHDHRAAPGSAAARRAAARGGRPARRLVSAGAAPRRPRPQPQP
jgi:hypothetical protein